MAHQRISRSVEFLGVLPRARSATRYVSDTTMTRPSTVSMCTSNRSAREAKGEVPATRPRGSNAVLASNATVAEAGHATSRCSVKVIMAMMAARTTPTARHWMLWRPAALAAT
jgi:hypothetical protein